MKKSFNLFSEIKNAFQVITFNKSAIEDVSKGGLGQTIFALLLPALLIVLTFALPEGRAEIAKVLTERELPADWSLLLASMTFVLIYFLMTFFLFMVHFTAKKIFSGHQVSYGHYLRPSFYSYILWLIGLIPFTGMADFFATNLLAAWGFVLSVFIIHSVYKFSYWRAIGSLALGFVLYMLLFMGFVFFLMALPSLLLGALS